MKKILTLILLGFLCLQVSAAPKFEVKKDFVKTEIVKQTIDIVKLQLSPSFTEISFIFNKNDVPKDDSVLAIQKDVQQLVKFGKSDINLDSQRIMRTCHDSFSNPSGHACYVNTVTGVYYSCYWDTAIDGTVFASATPLMGVCKC